MVLVATPPTCNVISTKSTHAFYTAESGNSDDESDAGSSVSSSSIDGIRETIKDTVATISTESMELDRIGFNEALDVDGTEGM